MAQITLNSGAGIAGQAYELVKGMLGGANPEGAVLDGSKADLHVRCINGDTFVLSVDGKAYRQGQSGSIATFTGHHLAALRGYLIQSDPFTAPK